MMENIHAHFGILILISSFQIIVSSGIRTNMEVHCERITGQQPNTLSDMMGMWYGIEILEHMHKNRPTVESCIKVELKELNSNTVELIWREKRFEVIYKFEIVDSRRPGVWTSLGSQTVHGGLSYEQFAGNIYVLKASDTNMVLTFCSAPSKLYTLVLSKTHTMNVTELGSIHGMVQRLGLPSPFDIKRYCKNRATTLDSLALLIEVWLIALFIRNLS